MEPIYAFHTSGTGIFDLFERYVRIKSLLLHEYTCIQYVFEPKELKRQFIEIEFDGLLTCFFYLFLMKSKKDNNNRVTTTATHTQMCRKKITMPKIVWLYYCNILRLLHSRLSTARINFLKLCFFSCLAIIFFLSFRLKFHISYITDM